MLKFFMKSLEESDSDEEDSQTSSKASINHDLALFGYDPIVDLDEIFGLDDL